MFIPVLDAIPYGISHLARLKINMTLPTKETGPDTHSIPHVDYHSDDQLLTALYYINDSDGDTYIFNEFEPYTGPLTLNRRVSPKRGRLVLFKCGRFHAGNNPSTNQPRLTLNANFYPTAKQ